MVFELIIFIWLHENVFLVVLIIGDNLAKVLLPDVVKPTVLYLTEKSVDEATLELSFNYLCSITSFGIWDGSPNTMRQIVFYSAAVHNVINIATFLNNGFKILRPSQRSVGLSYINWLRFRQNLLLA